MAEGVGFRVTAITYRNNPILTMIALGVPIDDSSIAASLTAGIAMKRGLKHREVPVMDVFVPPEGVTHLIYVSVKKGGAQITKEVLDYFTARRVMVSKVIVLDEDVDIFDSGQVLHAFATKCHPGRGIVVEHYEGRANSLTPCYNPKERERLKGASVAFDATWPPEWPQEIIPIKASFKTIYSKEIQEKVTQNWKSYGFK
jgi:4-hydroxy-3-polyprenylbenzoate decarboxylase